MDMSKGITVIIPAWNEKNIISTTCKFLGKLKLPFKFSELILVAGGNDGTFNICKEIKLTNFDIVKTLKQLQGDFKAGALIKGLNNAKGDIIILMDADTLVATNFTIEVEKSLKIFDAVNCDYFPLIQRGLWYNYYIINKLCWSKNTGNLSSLFGAATISLTKKVIDEIGINNFFTNKSTAGVDYYMGLVLKEYEKKLGLVRSTKVLTPRASNIKDFYKDNSRWFTAFFQIHQDNKKIVLSSLFQSILCIFFPLVIFLFNLKKMINLSMKKSQKFKFHLILFLVEYLLYLIKLNIIIKIWSRRIKSIGHFKGARY